MSSGKPASSTGHSQGITQMFIDDVRSHMPDSNTLLSNTTVLLYSSTPKKPDKHSSLQAELHLFRGAALRSNQALLSVRACTADSLLLRTLHQRSRNDVSIQRMVNNVGSVIDQAVFSPHAAICKEHVRDVDSGLVRAWFVDISKARFFVSSCRRARLRDSIAANLSHITNNY